MEIDKKKIPFFIIVIIAVILLSRYYLQVFTIGLSLVFLGYSAKKKNTFLLTLGLLGLFIATLIHKNIREKKEGFQAKKKTKAAESKVISTLKGEVPTKKCSTEDRVVTRISVEELTNMEYLLNTFFKIPSVKAREIIKKECIENVFDAIVSSHKYKQQDKSKQIVGNWQIRDGIMDKISDLYHIYNFDVKTLNTIINKNKSDFAGIVDSNIILSEFGTDSLEKLSLDYFLHSKKFTPKHFKILEYLDILNSDYKTKFTLQRPRGLYYDQKMKDYGSLMVSLEHFGYLRTNDLKTPFPDGDLNGDKWVVQTLEQIKLDDFNINNQPIFKKYQITNKISKKLDSLKKEKEEEVQNSLIDFSKSGSLLFEQINNEDQYSLNRGIQNREVDEYQKFIVNNTSNESEISKRAFKDLADVNIIRDKTISTINDIVDDTKNLMNEVGDYKNSKNGVKEYIDKYLMFFKGFMNILVKDQRAFFVGIILVTLSIITNFIEVSRN